MVGTITRGGRCLPDSRKFKSCYGARVDCYAWGENVNTLAATFDGAATGAATHRDFRIFAAALRDLEDGVVLNFGSAVILPEVFVKALSTVRNLGHPASRFIAASFDQIRHYRPDKNVLERPTRSGGTGHAFVGPHELWIPLLAALYLGRAPRIAP